jgi:hypothetical protein
MWPFRDAELGRSGIKSLFGSDMSDIPCTTTGGNSGHKYGTMVKDFPIPPGEKPVDLVNDVPAVYFGQVSTRTPIPNAWISSVLLQSFYDSAVQKYGFDAFKAPRLWEQRYVHRGFYNRAHRAIPIRNAESLQGAIVDGLDRDVGRALQELRVRRLTWHRLRPWYPKEYSLWQMTPYSNIRGRDMLLEFRNAISLESRLRDPRTAEILASNTSNLLNFFLINRGLRREDAPHASSLWIFQALAYMMHAVLPACIESKGDYATRLDPNRWGPSTHAIKAGTDRWRFPPTRTISQFSLAKTWRLRARHQARVPVISDAGQAIELKSNRVWLIEQALECKRVNENLFPLPEPLSQALETELHALFAQALLGRDEDWLRFEFEFPPYSSTLVTRDGAGNLTPFLNPDPTLSRADFDLSPHDPRFIAAAARVVPGRRRGSGVRLAQPRYKYFTVSEVGEKALDNGKGTNWALMADGQGGYDVVDVTGGFITSLP